MHRRCCLSRPGRLHACVFASPSRPKVWVAAPPWRGCNYRLLLPHAYGPLLHTHWYIPLGVSHSLLGIMSGLCRYCLGFPKLLLASPPNVGLPLPVRALPIAAGDFPLPTWDAVSVGLVIYGWALPSLFGLMLGFSHSLSGIMLGFSHSQFGIPFLFNTNTWLGESP